MLTADPGLGRTALLRHLAGTFTGGTACFAPAVPPRHTPDKMLGELYAGHPAERLRSALLRVGGPLLVCVDDLHLWPGSARAALHSVARGLAAEPAPIALVLSVAAHRATGLTDGLPVVRLTPLDDAAARALLEQHLDGRPSDPVVRERLLAAAGGSPLALRELAAAADGAHAAGGASARDFAGEAADGSVVRGAGGEVPGVRRIAQALRRVEAADRARLAGRTGRAARLLAPVRRLALPDAVTGRAELVHGLLEADTGPVADARASLLLAARLLAADDPDRALRARLAAAEASWAMGDATAYREALGPPTGQPPRAAGADEPVHSVGPSLRAAPEGLFRRADPDGPALPAGPDESPRPAVQVAALPDSPAGEHRSGTRGVRSADRPDTCPLDRPIGSYLRGMDAVLSGDAHGFGAGRDTLRQVVAAAGEPAAGDRAAGEAEELLLCASAAALVVGDLEAAGRLGSRALATARARGRLDVVPQALERLAYGELRAGRHARARAHAEDGVRTARLTGRRNSLAHHHAILALVASLDQDARTVAEHAAAAEETAVRHGLVQAATLAQWALARADLARGRPTEAAARLGPLLAPGPAQGHFAVRMLAVPCFVEAAVLAGRTGEVASAVDLFEQWAGFGHDPQAPAQLLRCKALLAGGSETADTLYTLALARHDATAGDFERARTALLHGKWLRRARRPAKAREALRDALLAFERCGAGAWAAQAAAELRATGEAAAPQPPGSLAGLTPQQLRIARLVAEGATNREAARHLSVSPRTVDHHLRNVFAALGVRSRVELARVVARADRSEADRSEADRSAADRSGTGRSAAEA